MRRVRIGWQDAHHYEQLRHVYGVWTWDVEWDDRVLYVVSDGTLRRSYSGRTRDTAAAHWRRARATYECGRPSQRWAVVRGERGMA